MHFYDRFYNDRRCHCRIMMKVLRDLVFLESNEVFQSGFKNWCFFSFSKLKMKATMRRAGESSTNISSDFVIMPVSNYPQMFKYKHFLHLFVPPSIHLWAQSLFIFFHISLCAVCLCVCVRISRLVSLVNKTKRASYVTGSLKWKESQFSNTGRMRQVYLKMMNADWTRAHVWFLNDIETTHICVSFSFRRITLLDQAFYSGVSAHVCYDRIGNGPFFFSTSSSSLFPYLVSMESIVPRAYTHTHTLIFMNYRQLFFAVFARLLFSNTLLFHV